MATERAWWLQWLLEHQSWWHTLPTGPGLGEPQRNKASLSQEIRLVKKAITQSRVPCSPGMDHGWTGLWKCLQALMKSLRNVLGASFLPWRCPGGMEGLPSTGSI